VKNDTVIYLPTGFDASTRWAIVANALREAGVTDIRPSPMPQRPVRKIQAPVLLSTMEV
jgi:hypothetical protein